MEVDEAGVIFPGGEESARLGVIGARAQAEVLLQVVPAADVVAGKNIEAAHAAEERVFGGPASNAAQGSEALERGLVVEIAKRFEVKFARCYGAAEFEDGAFFAGAVAQRVECARIEFGEIVWLRAGAKQIVARRWPAEIPHHSVEQHDADVERHLLAGDGVEQRFEQSGIARGFYAGERGDERA